MATDIVGGLFGVSPEMYQRQMNRQVMQDAIAMQRLDPLQRAGAMTQAGAYQLGQGLGGAFGVEDPMLKVISARQQIGRSIDFTDPESIAKGVRQLADIGDTQGAGMLAQEGRKALESSALVAQRTAEKQTPEQRNALAIVLSKGLDPRTPEGRKAYETELTRLTSKQTNIADPIQVANEIENISTKLQSLDKESPEYKPLEEKLKFLTKQKDKLSAFGQTLVDAGLQPGTPDFERRMIEYAGAKIEGVKKGQGLSIGGISIDSGKGSEAAAKTLAEQLVNIQGQYNLLESLRDAKDLVNQGVYGGAYGPELKNLAKFGGVGSREKLIRTETLMSTIGETVLPRLKEFGGNDSNEELRYLTRITGGDERIEPETLKRILTSAEAKIRRGIKRMEQQQKSAVTGTPLSTAPLPQEPVTQPQESPTQRRVIQFNELKSGF